MKFLRFGLFCILLLISSAALGNEPSASHSLKPSNEKKAKKDPSADKQLAVFALNPGAREARLKIFNAPTKENLIEWRNAILKDPGIRQKVQSSRISKEAQEEILLLLRGADFEKLGKDGAIALGEVLGALHTNVGQTFTDDLINSAFRDPKISTRNKLFFSIRLASAFRFFRDWPSTQKLLLKSTQHLSRLKNPSSDPMILSEIRWFAESQDLFSNVRWLYFFNSLYLTSQRYLGSEADVDLKPLYLRHLVSLVTLGQWSDAVQFGNFLSKLQNSSWTIQDRRALLDAQLTALVFSGDRSAPRLADQFIEENKGRDGWTSLQTDITLVRKALAYIYLGEAQPAKLILDQMANKNLNDREFKLNLLRVRSRLHVYQEAWPAALSDIQSYLLLEPSARTSVMRSFWDIFALFVKDRISMRITGDDDTALLDVIRKSPDAAETFWSIKPLAELAQILYNRNKTSDLKFLIRYARKQYSDVPLKPYLAFFNAWGELDELRKLPKETLNLQIVPLEAKFKSLRALDAMLAKHLLGALAQLKPKAGAKKKGA